MRAPSAVHLLLGLAACKSFLATIRPAGTDNFLKVAGKSIELTPNRADGLATFLVSVKEKKGFKLFGLKVMGRRYLVLISPASTPGLYLGYSRSRGLHVHKKKKYWEYKDVGNGGYALKTAEDRCLGVTENGTLDIAKCNNASEQMFLFEERIEDQSTTTSDDGHLLVTTDAHQAPGKDARIPFDNLSSSCESSDSDSDSNITKPVFINLNVKGGRMDNQPEALSSSTTVTTTVYVSVTKSVAAAPTKTASKEPLPVSISSPLPMAHTRDRKAQRPAEDSESSCGSDEGSRREDICHGVFVGEDCEESRGREGLSLSFDDQYPELGRLLKNAGRRGEEYIRKAGALKRGIGSVVNSPQQPANSCVYPGTGIGNPSYQSSILCNTPLYQL